MYICISVYPVHNKIYKIHCTYFIQSDFCKSYGYNWWNICIPDFWPATQFMALLMKTFYETAETGWFGPGGAKQKRDESPTWKSPEK